MTHRPPGEGRIYGRRRDPDATVIMPAVDPDLTMVLPAYQPGAGAVPPTEQLPPGGGPVPPDDGGTASVTRNSAVMAVGSLVSRVTGFLRNTVIGAALGSHALFNAYNTANILPNMVYELLLGGILASVVVPLLVRARQRDPDGGEAYAQRLLSLATVFLAAATAFAVLLAPLLTRIVAHKSSVAQQHLITYLSFLLLPEIFFYGVAALLAAILNTRGHFAAPMWTPILNNVVVIFVAIVYMIMWYHLGEQSATQVSSAQLLLLGVGTTLGIVAQAGGLFPALRKVRFRWRWRSDWRQLHLRELARVGSWMLLYVAVSQVALFVLLTLAQRASDRGGPGIGVFNNAYLIFMMAHGIVAVSIITALLPRMSTAAAQHRYDEVAAHLSLGTRLSAVILVPATAAYLVLGRQLGVALFAYGHYGVPSGIATGWVIAASALGLIPFAISQLQVFAFYALPDTKTPALLNIPVAALRIVVYLVLYATLAAGAVAAGLMIGNAVSFVVAAALGYWQLRRRLGPIGLTDVLRTLGRLGLAAAIAAVPTWLLTLILVHTIGLGQVASIVELIVGGLMLIVVYLAAAVSLRVREISDVWGMVRSRIGR